MTERLAQAAGAAIVVGLGTVDPALVADPLGRATFVASPQPDDLAAAAGAIVRADAVVDRALLERMPNLRVLARTGVGVDRPEADHDRAACGQRSSLSHWAPRRMRAGRRSRP